MKARIRMPPAGQIGTGTARMSSSARFGLVPGAAFAALEAVGHHRWQHRLHILRQRRVAAGDEGMGLRGTQQTQRGAR